MFDFIATGRGIQILYRYAEREIVASDFFELTTEGYEQLSAIEKTQKWYTINPEKLNKNYIEEGSYFIVNEREKAILLLAVQFIKFVSENLPTDASFLERLLYAKHCIPDFFSDTSERIENNNCRIIELNPDCNNPLDQSDDKN